MGASVVVVLGAFVVVVVGAFVVVVVGPIVVVVLGAIVVVGFVCGNVTDGLNVDVGFRGFKGQGL